MVGGIGMTREDKREEEIGWVSEGFLSGALCDTKFTEEEEEFIEYCFRSGAQWADENPQIPWISVKDKLPDDDTKLYLIYCEAYTIEHNTIKNKHHEFYLANYDKDNSTWCNVIDYNNYSFDVLYYMQVPKLPKE